MQTFLPYESFVKTAKCLDKKRLGKQRVEAYQILKVLLGIGKRNKNGKLAWENHPAVKMWKGHEFLLVSYIMIICTEWKRRGCNDTVLEKTLELINKLPKEFKAKYSQQIPIWYYNKDFHASHRSNLLRKDIEYYSQFGWNEPNNLPYYWPVK